MTSQPRWQYDEFHHVGADYSDENVAEKYDAYHQQFRGDMVAAADVLLDELGVTAGHVLVDIGCGTGTLAIQAARRGASAVGADVSEAMLNVARRKAAGVAGVTFARGGFLTYEHTGPAADFVTSTAALHHLPDFWKLVGLRRVARMLKPGGVFYLMDTVYSFDVDTHGAFFAEKTAWIEERVGQEFGSETVTAFREEFSTCDWIMEGILERAGFEIVKAEYSDGWLARYSCRAK